MTQEDGQGWSPMDYPPATAGMPMVSPQALNMASAMLTQPAPSEYGGVNPSWAPQPPSDPRWGFSQPSQNPGWRPASSATPMPSPAMAAPQHQKYFTADTNYMSKEGYERWWNMQHGQPASDFGAHAPQPFYGGSQPVGQPYPTPQMTAQMAPHTGDAFSRNLDNYHAQQAGMGYAPPPPPAPRRRNVSTSNGAKGSAKGKGGKPPAGRQEDMTWRHDPNDPTWQPGYGKKDNSTSAPPSGTSAPPAQADPDYYARKKAFMQKHPGVRMDQPVDPTKINLDDPQMESHVSGWNSFYHLPSGYTGVHAGEINPYKQAAAKSVVDAYGMAAPALGSVNAVTAARLAQEGMSLGTAAQRGALGAAQAMDRARMRYNPNAPAPPSRPAPAAATPPRAAARPGGPLQERPIMTGGNGQIPGQPPVVKTSATLQGNLPAKVSRTKPSLEPPPKYSGAKVSDYGTKAPSTQNQQAIDWQNNRLQSALDNSPRFQAWKAKRAGGQAPAAPPPPKPSEAPKMTGGNGQVPGQPPKPKYSGSKVSDYGKNSPSSQNPQAVDWQKNNLQSALDNSPKFQAWKAKKAAGKK